MIKLFRTFIEENRDIWNDDLKSEIYKIAEKMVELEDMDLANFRASLEMAEIIKMTGGSESKHPLFRKDETKAKKPALKA